MQCVFFYRTCAMGDGRAGVELFATRDPVKFDRDNPTAVPFDIPEDVNPPVPGMLWHMNTMFTSTETPEEFLLLLSAWVTWARDGLRLGARNVTAIMRQADPTPTPAPQHPCDACGGACQFEGSIAAPGSGQRWRCTACGTPHKKMGASFFRE